MREDLFSGEYDLQQTEDQVLLSVSSATSLEFIAAVLSKTDAILKYFVELYQVLKPQVQVQVQVLRYKVQVRVQVHRFRCKNWSPLQLSSRSLNRLKKNLFSDNL